jgi:prepilin peptidase CpaA
MATAILACALAASALLLLVAAWCDLATRTIPDGISIALAVLGLLSRASEGVYPALVSLLLAAILFAAFLPIHARGAIGGGDVKLITALAIGFPPAATLDFLLATVTAGGVLALLYLSLRLLPQPSPLVPQPQAWPPRRILALERRRVSRRGPLPYAVAIAAGGILTLMKPFGG